VKKISALPLLVVFLIAASANFALAANKSLLNLDKNGVAIQGYDPVAFFTQNHPVKGKAEFQSTYNGARYQFASPEDKAEFDKNPAKYEPQFGGYCAYGASQGHTAPVKIEAFQIVNGRLLMQYDLDVKKEFNKDQAGNLKLADEKWPGLVDKLGK
jgi:YHS domain-containing protein